MKLLFTVIMFARTGFGVFGVDDMTYYKLPKSTAPGGKCMDGTMAGYYVREGTNTNLFVINLAGGGACSDEKGCKQRSGTRKGSSKFDLDSKRGDGLIDPSCDVNPSFCEATHVHVLYCTSDTHRGIREKRSDDSEWYSKYYFDGHSNFKAIVEVLKKEKGLENNVDTKVLLTGISAGGVGALYNVDTLQEMISEATVKTAPIGGWFNPGALSGDLPSIYPPSDYTYFKKDEHGNELYDLIQGGGEQVDVWEMRNTLPADCRAAYVDGDDDKYWACYSIHIAYPYIKAPIFAISSQYDNYHIYTGGGAPTNIIDPEEQTIFNRYVDMMGRAERLSFKQLVDDNTKTTKEHPDGIFAPSCKVHGTPNDVTITDGKTWIEIVSDWFFQAKELQDYYKQIEDCSTDQAGLVLPCNANNEKCSFEFEDQDPLFEICRQKVESVGCLLMKKNKKICLQCVEQNKNEIIDEKCNPKNKKEAEKILKQICSLDPLVEICLQKVEDVGCLDTKNDKECLKCANENKKEIFDGECKPKNNKKEKKIFKEICSSVLDDPEEPDDPEVNDDPKAKFVVKKKKNGKEKKKTCGKLIEMNGKKIEKYCSDQTYGEKGAAVVCPVTCSSNN